MENNYIQSVTIYKGNNATKHHLREGKREKFFYFFIIILLYFDFQSTTQVIRAESSWKWNYLEDMVQL